MRRLTKIRRSVYEPESYAVYISKDGEQYSAIAMTSTQTQQVLDKLAMYEDLDECGLVAKKLKSAEPLREAKTAITYSENTLLDWLEKKLDNVEDVINEIKRKVKKNET